MDSADLSSPVPRTDVVRSLNELRCRLRRLADAAMVIPPRHLAQMKADEAYREKVDMVIEWCSSRQGWVGKTSRVLADVHALLIQLA